MGRDVALARQISAAAVRLQAPADPAAVQHVQVAIDALNIAQVRPFWHAVLGYAAAGEEELLDAQRQGPTFWFQQMESPRTGRNASTSTSMCRMTRCRPELTPRPRLAAGSSATPMRQIGGHSPIPKATRLTWRSGDMQSRGPTVKRTSSRSQPRRAPKPATESGRLVAVCNAGRPGSAMGCLRNRKPGVERCSL
jgi:hypothetical protein